MLRCSRQEINTQTLLLHTTTATFSLLLVLCLVTTCTPLSRSLDARNSSTVADMYTDLQKRLDRPIPAGAANAWCQPAMPVWPAGHTGDSNDCLANTMPGLLVHAGLFSDTSGGITYDATVCGTADALPSGCAQDQKGTSLPNPSRVEACSILSNQIPAGASGNPRVKTYDPASGGSGGTGGPNAQPAGVIYDPMETGMLCAMFFLTPS